MKIAVIGGGISGLSAAWLLSCHSDQALGMLADTSSQERSILGAITYQPNFAVLHTDESFLPRNPKAWAAWNYHAGAGRPGCRPPVPFFESLTRDSAREKDATMRRMPG